MSDEQATDPGTTDKAKAENTWFETLPEQTRGEYQALKGKSLPEVLTGYRQLEERIGKAIEVPGEDATQKDREAFAAKLKAVMKVPGSAEDYVKALPKEVPVDDPMVAAFIESAHASGLTVDQVNSVIATVATRLQARSEEVKQKAVESLKKEWGNDFVANLEMAHLGLKKAAAEAGISPEDIERTIDATGWGNNPVLIKMFVNIGRFYREDSMTGARGTQGPQHKYSDSGHPILRYEPDFGRK